MIKYYAAKVRFTVDDFQTDREIENAMHDGILCKNCYELVDGYTHPDPRNCPDCVRELREVNAPLYLDMLYTMKAITTC